MSPVQFLVPMQLPLNLFKISRGEIFLQLLSVSILRAPRRRPPEYEAA
jgi:hypothetical protein